MPEAFISITTSPGPGVGSGKFLSSTLRSPRKTTPRTRLRLLRDFGLLAGGLLQRQRGRGALALPLVFVDLLAEEVELDGDVVRILEEDLEERRLRIREAAEVHLDLVLLDAAAPLGGVLRGERDVIDRARAARALGMLLQQELVADLVRLLRGEVHAGVAVRLEPVAGKAEIRPCLVDFHAEHALVELARSLQVLRDEQKMVQFGDGHLARLLAGFDSTHRCGGANAAFRTLRRAAWQGGLMGADAAGAGRKNARSRCRYAA